MQETACHSAAHQVTKQSQCTIHLSTTCTILIDNKTALITTVIVIVKVTVETDLKAGIPLRQEDQAIECPPLYGYRVSTSTEKVFELLLII